MVAVALMEDGVSEWDSNRENEEDATDQKISGERTARTCSLFGH